MATPIMETKPVNNITNKVVELDGVKFIRFDTRDEFMSYLHKMYMADIYISSYGRTTKTGYEEKYGDYKGFDVKERFFDNNITYVTILDLLDSIGVNNIYFTDKLVEFINELSPITEEHLNRYEASTLSQIVDLMCSGHILLNMNAAIKDNLKFYIPSANHICFENGYLVLRSYMC